MNIFWLSLNSKINVKYHCDKHVVKMILEYAQMLCTAHHILGYSRPELYKSTHVNHPCSIWARATSANYMKLYEIFVLLCSEYTHRYGKVHKTESKLREILKTPPIDIPKGGLTVPPIAISNNEILIRKEQGISVVQSYRNYYNVEKRSFAKWTKRDVPKWFEEYRQSVK